MGQKIQGSNTGASLEKNWQMEQVLGRQKKIQEVNTISLNKFADLAINQKNYQHKKRIQKTIQRKLKKLENIETLIARADTNNNTDYLR